MIIYIDADGCPVTDITIKAAVKYNIEAVAVADTSHYFESENELVSVLIVSKGSDSADFAILSRCKSGDIVVTQDYALAAMCLAKGAHPINQNGILYTNDNIDEMLMRRHINRQIRNAGGRTPHARKRKNEQNEAFSAALYGLINKLLLTNK